jgi:hypothetical protein
LANQLTNLLCFSQTVLLAMIAVCCGDLSLNGVKMEFFFLTGKKKDFTISRKPLILLVAMGGVEPPTLGL